MKTMLVTIVAMEDQEVVSDCQGELNLTTFEITDLTDTTFVSASEDSYDGFALELEGKYYPLGVDYIAGNNEFMLMDADGIDAIEAFAADNQEMVDGEDDFDEFDDGNEDENDEEF